MAKIKPNEPCPCNSGKKFKKCCSLKQVLPKVAVTTPTRTSASASASTSRNKKSSSSNSKGNRGGKSELKKEARKATEEQKQRKAESVKIIPETAHVNDDNDNIMVLFQNCYSNTLSIEGNGLLGILHIPDSVVELLHWPKKLPYPPNANIRLLALFFKMLRTAVFAGIRVGTNEESPFISDDAIIVWIEIVERMEGKPNETLAWALEMCRSPYHISPRWLFFQLGSAADDDDDDDDNSLSVSAFVFDCVILLQCLLEYYNEESSSSSMIDGDGDNNNNNDNNHINNNMLQIDANIVRQLVPIYQLVSMSNSTKINFLSETITEILKKYTTEDGFWVIVNEIKSKPKGGEAVEVNEGVLEGGSWGGGVPRRGALSMLAGKIAANNDWAKLSPHIEQLCRFISDDILSKKSSNDETNGWCLYSLMELMKNPDWVERIMELVFEPIRDCCLRGQLDTMVAGGLSEFLMAANGIVISNKKKINTNGDVSNDDDNGNQDPYEYFMEMYSLNPRGISDCNCSKHGVGCFPEAICQKLKNDELKKVISKMLGQVDMALSNNLYDTALEMTNSLLHLMETNVRILGSLKTSRMNFEIYYRLGRCHFGLNNFQRTLDSFMMDYFFSFVRSINQIFEVRYVSSVINIEAMFYMARALAQLGRKEEALAWAKQVAKVETPDGDTDVRTSKEEITIEANQFIQDITQGRILPLLPKEQIDGKPLLVKAAPPLEAVLCTVRRCSWYSVGSVQSEGGFLIPDSYVASRLNWVLVWIRERLLIWDYKLNEVVQWITLHEGQIVRDWKCFETTPSSTVCIFFTGSDSVHRRENDCYVILLDELVRLPRGATNEAHTAMLATLGEDQLASEKGVQLQCKRKFTGQQIYGQTIDFLSWYNLCSSMCKEVFRRGGSIAGFDAINNNDSTSCSWNLALYDSNMTSLTCINAIYVYRSTAIAPGAALGPLALLTRNAPLVLSSHSKTLYSIGFVPPSRNNDVVNFLVSTANDRTMKIWDLNNKEKCRHTIRDFNAMVRHVTYSPTLIFGSTFSDFANRNKEQEMNAFGTHCVDIFKIDTAKHIASLQHDEAVENITFDKDRNLLFVSLEGGNLNIWRIDDNATGNNRIIASHLHGLQLFPPNFAGCRDGFMITHLNPNNGNSNKEDDDDDDDNCGKMNTSIIVSTMKELIFLSDPCETEEVNNRVNGSTFDAIVKDGNGVLQNCGYCYRYKITSKSNMCSRCKSVRYCDTICQKKGWKDHKLFCLPAAT